MSFTRTPCNLLRGTHDGLGDLSLSLVGDVAGEMPQQETEPGVKGAVQLLAASANANFADKIAKALLRAGYRLDPGEFDPERIDAVIVLWTGVALDKPALIEVAKKAWKARRLTPVSIGRVEPPFGAKEAAPMDLAGWRGDDADPRWRFVLSDIETLKARAELDQPAAPPSVAPLAPAPKVTAFEVAPQIAASEAPAAPNFLDDPFTDDYAAPHHPARALWRKRLLPAAPIFAGGVGLLAFAAGLSFMVGSLRSRPAPIEIAATEMTAREAAPVEAETEPAPTVDLALVRLAPGAKSPEDETIAIETAPNPDASDGAEMEDVAGAIDEEEAEEGEAPTGLAAIVAPSLKPEPPMGEDIPAADLNQAALAELASAVETAERAAESEGTRENYLGDYFSDCAGCPDMAALDGGVFLMGAQANEQDRQTEETPQRRVAIGYRFAIATRETTFDQWALCIAEGGCRNYIPDEAGWGRGERPVINVSYEDAAAYARWLSAKTGHYYRLPSEAEWEFAARGGTAAATHFGDALSAADANFDGRYPYRAEATILRGRTVPVTQFPHNAYGLFDMHGNVAEWTLDCWNPGHHGGPATGAARIDGDCARRVVKGGAWNSPGWRVRSAARRGAGAETRGTDTGFRVVRVLD